MRIAFIGQKGMPAINGGVERYVESVSIDLASRGEDVLVYNRNDYLPERLSEFKGVRIINKTYYRSKNLANITHTFFASLDVLFRRVDVVHFQGVGPSLLCWLPKLFSGRRIKIVATLHSFDYYNDKWGIFARWMLKVGECLMVNCADELIVLTKAMQNYLKKEYGRESNLITNGANLYNEVGQDRLLAWGLEKNNYIISVARIIRLKGLQYLITAFKELETDKYLVIVGEGEYLSELKKMAAGDHRIIFTGNQIGRTLDQFYANAYLFVQSSETEGLSISLLEAMAHRTACLVSDIEANLEATNGTGFTFKNKDSRDLKIKLKELLDNSSLVENQAGLAYQRAARNFSWSEISRQILAIYKK